MEGRGQWVSGSTVGSLPPSQPTFSLAGRLYFSITPGLRPTVIAARRSGSRGASVADRPPPHPVRRLQGGAREVGVPSRRDCPRLVNHKAPAPARPSRG